MVRGLLSRTRMKESCEPSQPLRLPLMARSPGCLLTAGRTRAVDDARLAVVDAAAGCFACAISQSGQEFYYRA
jgi:hypothetical protein